MPLIRKRRAQAEPSPSPPPTRHRPSPSPSTDEEDVETSMALAEDNSEITATQRGSGGVYDQMVKKLVRLALASEYSRQPVRRIDISAKVMAPGTGRQFKHVLEEAQHQLRTVFGMQLVELPQKEKISISQKRAAQRSQNGGSSTSKSYVLVSTLPSNYRTPKILTPARIPSSAIEAAYTGLYTFIISIIALSPRGTIPESRLERHLGRMNADDYVLGGEKTEKVLKRMEREGYIVKVTERDGGGEESVEYVVGPRGKAEVGEIGVAGMVRKVYGKRDVEADELDRKLVRSLGEVVLDKKRRRREGGEGEGEGEGEAEVEEGGRGEGGRGGGGGRGVGRRGGGGGRREIRNDDASEDDEDEGPSSRRRRPSGQNRTRRSRNQPEVEDEEEDEEDEDSEDQGEQDDDDDDDEEEEDEEDEEE